MRRAAAVVAVLLALGACSQDERFLPVGEYAGSTSLDAPFTLTVAGTPKVNGQKGQWDERGAIKVKGMPVIRCRTVNGGEELRCQVGDETVELLRV